MAWGPCVGKNPMVVTISMCIIISDIWHVLVQMRWVQVTEIQKLLLAEKEFVAKV